MNRENAFNLANVIDLKTEKDVQLVIARQSPNVTGMQYTLKKCTMDSQSTSSSIGSNKSVDLTFTTQIGGVSDTDHGIFCTTWTGTFSGNHPIFPLVPNTYQYNI